MTEAVHDDVWLHDFAERMKGGGNSMKNYAVQWKENIIYKQLHQLLCVSYQAGVGVTHIE
jgi:hypothetical protein